MLIRKLLSKEAQDQIKSNELYAQLSAGSATATNRFKSRATEAHGLGRYFAKKTRAQFATLSKISDAFDIKDDATPPTAEVKSVEALRNLAKHFKDGGTLIVDPAKPKEVITIKKNPHKYALCLALVVNKLGEKAELSEVEELSKMYKGVPSIEKALELRKTDIVAAKKRAADEAELLKQQQNNNNQPPAWVAQVTTFLSGLNTQAQPAGQSLSANKKAQAEQFSAQLKNLDANALSYLLQVMNATATGKTDKDNEALARQFNVVRTERHFFRFGQYGNTKTWQAMVSAVKMELLSKLQVATATATKKDNKAELTVVNYDTVKKLVSQHHGRMGTRFGSTKSLTAFNTRFFKTEPKPAEKPKDQQQQQQQQMQPK